MLLNVDSECVPVQNRKSGVKGTNKSTSLLLTDRQRCGAYLAAAEISEFADVGQCDDHVGGFEVEVNDAGVVEVAYCT